MKLRIWNSILGDKIYRAIEKSRLFDRDWYLSEYPDVAAAKVDPVAHFVEFGALEGRKPNPLFDTDWYLSQNPGVAAAKINPLIDYIEHAFAGGRDPNPLFLTHWYLDRYPDVQEAGINPLRHYLEHGGAECLDPGPLFDAKWYLKKYPEVVGRKVTPLQDYFENAGSGKRSPHPLFDGAQYLKRNPDVAAAGMDPLRHYMMHGANEGRDPNPFFDADWYLARYPEVAKARRNPLLDYLENWRDGARDPHPGFETAWYLSQYPDVLADEIDPLSHYLTKGLGEGRQPKPEVSSTSFSPIVHEPWQEPEGEAWVISFKNRLKERMAALGQMDLVRPFEGDRVTFSITTTVYNTRPSFIRELAETIRDQAFEDYEWLILDNGSTEEETTAVLLEIAASDPRFKLFRVENNLHIIGGNRHLLAKASGHYIVPVDSDDILYRDSLAQFAQTLRDSKTAPPSLMYSDEQRVTEDGQPSALMWRWEFTFAGAMTTVPAAHLMAFSTDIGRKVGVYAHDAAKGSHDWDTFLRIAEQGGRVVHVPEVLYGWRIHELSTASSIGAKDYIENSHIKVLEGSLKRLGLEGLFSFPQIFGGLGWYHPKRSMERLSPVELVFVLGAAQSETRNLRHNLKVTSGIPARRRVLFPAYRAKQAYVLQKEFADAEIDWESCKTQEEAVGRFNAGAESYFAKVLISSTLRIIDAQAVLDAIGTLELDVRAGAVGGPLLSESGVLLNTGLTAGVGRFVGSPFYGWHKSDAPGYLWRVTRKATATSTLFMAIRSSLIVELGGLRGLDDHDAIHGLDFCQRCADAGYSTVYVPTMIGYREQAVAGSVGEGTPARARQGLKAPLASMVPTQFSPHLSRNQNRFGFLRAPSEASVLPGVDYVPFGPAVPLNLIIDPDLAEEPTINLLLPAARMEHMSGGPNTALNLAYRLAHEGFPLRILSTDKEADANVEPVIRHMKALTGIEDSIPVEIVSANDRTKPVAIGANDIFMATAWWTAQMARHGSAMLGGRPFIYLIQDFEPILYAASSLHVQAYETYSFDYIPVINTDLLREFLTTHKVGRFADGQFASSAITFEPSVSREAFHPEITQRGKRRLLFYARPTTGVRNLWEIGVSALRAAIEAGILSPLNWTFLGMGEQFQPLPLARNAWLECASWLGFDDYAKQMRQSDLLLSLMASPHPSYPPYEMAACGGMVVTNTYENKTGEKLSGISQNIVSAPPTLEGIVTALEQAVARLDDVDARKEAADVRLPLTWDDSFSAVIPALKDRLFANGIGIVPVEERFAKLPVSARQGKKADPLAVYLESASADARQRYDVPQQEGLLSFITTVWNTPPEFVEVLARSVKSQWGGTNFEWFILDNGSSKPATRQLLERLGTEDFVRIERVEENLGIVGGMRYCLERASGRYVMPLDSDDYLLPQTVQAITWHLQKHGFPPLLYSDEMLLSGSTLHTPYFKPEWDPVLFVNSCYIAHLGVIDRALALELDVYSDSSAEGCHDWDTFTRFMLAGHVPVHIPELLYAWRVHQQSTAGNIDSKPFISNSHRAILSKFLDSTGKAGLFDLQRSPLFNNTPDWWFKRRHIDPKPMTTVVVVSSTDAQRRNELGWPVQVDLKVSPDVDHRVVHFGIDKPLTELLTTVRQCAEEERLVHVVAGAAQPDSDEWYWEAIGQLELFPDAAMVGGGIHTYNTVLAGGLVFGFNDGCGSPDRGRPMTDPGYFAQMWKPHSVDAVSAQHAVFRAEFLLQVLKVAEDVSMSATYLGQWAGAVARRLGERVIFSPFVSAETRSDWDALVPAEEKVSFRRVFADLIVDPPLMSPYLFHINEDGYQPVRQARPLEERLGSQSGVVRIRKEKASGSTRSPGKPEITFSILTTLYLGTDAVLFEKTAASVLAQFHAAWQWCILAHGPITAALDLVLRRLSSNPKVLIKRLPTNLGIMGGMRAVLDFAEGEYAIPLDGDDLFTVDCLERFATYILRAPQRPAYLYSDEDIVVGDTCRSPYRRPDWDPVLDLENSWIWHAVAFERKTALEIGIFTDSGSEYCHDWDTVHRFAQAGYVPVHIPEVLYHWRHHPGSTSNSEIRNTGSAESTYHLLKQKIEQRNLGDLYEVAPYPLYRGAKEWWIRRQPVNVPRVRQAIVRASGKSSRIEIADFVADHVVVSYSVQGLKELKSWAQSLVDDEIALFTSANLGPIEEQAVLEAIKLFDCCPEVVVVSGKVVSEQRIVAAGLSVSHDGLLHAPFDDLAIGDSGEYAMALKPQCISAPILDLFFARGAVLRDALQATPDGCSFAELALWLGAHAQNTGRRIAHSPLIMAEAAGPVLQKPQTRMDRLSWKAFQKVAAGGRAFSDRFSAGEEPIPAIDVI